MIPLIVLLSSCAQTNSVVVTKVEFKKLFIPDEYFILHDVNSSVSISNSKDISYFILNLYERYDECRLNLNEIKKINERWKNNDGNSK
ncbi:hypothetical protein [Campylobacter fetus]|uniref:hypothetical protein n=1 Tax=Campylobacter fetus TaxID=196 RepID=UPI0008187E8B|nr:hypothetical protein [Campylobacter fetus]OCR88061.1 hypothetical protein CFT13S00388_02525 [Campylobacter fetus subsp. testudinum]